MAHFDQVKANTSFWTRTSSSKVYCQGRFCGPLARRRWPPIVLARLPTLIWPRQAPVDGVPEDVTSIVQAYGAWLSQSEMPKLFVAGDPGAVISAGSANLRFCRTLKNQQEVTVKGRHFLQEDSPAEIGAALRAFVTETRRSGH